VNLLNCAVRLNHDHFIIDVDAENTTYHFKSENREDFHKWIGAFEKVSSKDMAMSNSALDLPYGNEGTSGRVSEFDIIYSTTSNLVDVLIGELLKTKDLLKLSKSKMDGQIGRKGMISPNLEFGELVTKLSAMNNVAMQNAKSLSEETLKMKQYLKEPSARLNQAHDSAFMACLEDNNRIRKKYGLDVVTAGKFISDHSEGLMNSKSSRTTLESEDDYFYDAEGGDLSEFESTESESESMQDAQDFNSNPEHSVDSEVESISETTEVVMKKTSAISLAPTVTKVTRRSTLPAPAQSMENISIMGILRNNIGKDLSTGILHLI
jgi:hypothetical protein